MSNRHKLNNGASLIGLSVLKKEPPKLERQDYLKFVPADKMCLMKEMGLDENGVKELPDGYVAGFASTDDLDLVRDVVVAGAFDESIARRGLTGPEGVKLLLDHDSSKVAGKITKLETRGGRLWMEAQLNLDISYVKDRYLAAKDIGGMSFSVGFRIIEYAFKKVEDEDFEFLEITKGDLFEVSVVAFPANPAAAMTFIKSLNDLGNFTSLAELEKALVADQFQVKSRNAAHALVAAVKRLVLPKEAPAATDPEPDLSEVLALAKSINEPEQE